MKGLFFLFLLISIPLSACASRLTTEAPSKEISTVIDTSKSAPAPEKEWENTLRQARKEGKVFVYSTAGGQIRNAVIKGFKDSLGLDAEIVTGRGSELAQKLLSEKRGGLHIVDVYMGGQSTILTRLKPEDILEYLPPVLILPEVKNGKYWWKGELRWVDKDKKLLSSWAYPSGELAVNTVLVEEKELSSLKGLLNPKWERKIIINDPTIEGPMPPWLATVIKNMGVNFLKDLAKQEPTITRDDRLQIEWLARGKYAIAIGTSRAVLKEFREAGASLKTISPPESMYLAGGSGTITLIKQSPHTSAAKIFINWFLSREGQLISSKAQNVQSARIDLPTDFLDPDRIRKPNIDYWESIKEENIPLRVESLKLAKEIFGPLMK